jgi:hypothetical protein
MGLLLSLERMAAMNHIGPPIVIVAMFAPEKARDPVSFGT